jgi:hypothetical protein
MPLPTTQTSACESFNSRAGSGRCAVAIQTETVSPESVFMVQDLPQQSQSQSPLLVARHRDARRLPYPERGRTQRISPHLSAPGSEMAARPASRIAMDRISGLRAGRPYEGHVQISPGNLGYQRHPSRHRTQPSFLAVKASTGPSCHSRARYSTSRQNSRPIVSSTSMRR